RSDRVRPGTQACLSPDPSLFVDSTPSSLSRVNRRSRRGAAAVPLGPIDAPMARAVHDAPPATSKPTTSGSTAAAGGVACASAVNWRTDVGLPGSARRADGGGGGFELPFISISLQGYGVGSGVRSAPILDRHGCQIGRAHV